MPNDQKLSDKTLMKLHLIYNQMKNDPLSQKYLSGINLHQRIEQLEYEIHQRTSIKHLWNIECLQRNNNITPTI